MSAVATDPVFLEVFRAQVQGVVEEMGEIVMRCGHTVFVKETQDFVVALVTPGGEVAACSQRVGIWIAVGQPFGAVLRSAGPYRPGDVWFTNDPEDSRGLVTHLPDVFCWRPVFHEGELVCFAAAFLHCTDVGGLAPGSVAPLAADQFAEGIAVPITRLVEQEQVREDVLRIFLRNSRVPEKNRGDLEALLAALRRAEQRVVGLCGKFGAPAVREGLEGLLRYAEAQARAVIRSLPDGEYTFWDYLEGDFLPLRRPVRIRLTLRVAGDELECDFSGTDPQVPAAFNVPTYGTHGHYLLAMGIVNFLRSVRPDVVYNSGMLRPVRFHLPRGSLLNPEPYAPCGARQATFFRVADVVLGALSRVWPDRLPAAGCGQGAIMLVSVPDVRAGSRVVSIVQPLVGGSGARPHEDGTDGVDFATGFYRNIPTEVLESEVPVLVERYGLREGSGGAGRTRGGMGIHYALRVLAPGAVVTCRGLERYRFQPWGRGGGRAGLPGRTWLEGPDGELRDLGKINVFELHPGWVLHVETAGGGGYGPPWERDPQAVAEDVSAGLYTPQQAREVFAVALRPDGSPDPEETARLRQAMRGAEVADFDFGGARAAHEHTWTDRVQCALVAATEGIPASLRQPLFYQLAQEFEESDGADDPEGWARRRVAELLADLAEH